MPIARARGADDGSDLSLATIWTTVTYALLSFQRPPRARQGDSRPGTVRLEGDHPV